MAYHLVASGRGARSLLAWSAPLLLATLLTPSAFASDIKPVETAHARAQAKLDNAYKELTGGNLQGAETSFRDISKPSP